MNPVQMENLQCSWITRKKLISMALRRFCVFCGNAPEDKNREDVVPTWLQELTGNPSRTANWTSSNGSHQFSFSSFKFPACTDCNTAFSETEGKVKQIFENLQKVIFLSEGDMDLLLDWFDKVRIGLWLGLKYIGKATEGHERHFHILDRVGKKDRSLHIYKTDEPLKRLNFFGVGNKPFDHIPSSFVMIVNDLVFINTSYDFLYSKSLGFPYPVDSNHDLVDGKVLSSYKFVSGTGIAKFRIAPIPELPPTLSIYQAILPQPNQNFMPSKMLLPGSTTKSVIFVKFENKIKQLEGSHVIKFYTYKDIEPCLKVYHNSFNSWIKTFRYLIKITKKNIAMKENEKSIKKWLRIMYLDIQVIFYRKRIRAFFGLPH